MRRSIGARTQALVLLALVATAGAVAGAVGDRLLTDRTTPSAPGSTAEPPAGGPWRWEARPDGRYAERLAESLELTAEQELQIHAIVAEEQVRVQELTRELQPRFRAIAEETRGRIEGVLTAEQQQRLHTLRQERMRGLRQGGRMGPGRDGGPGGADGPGAAWRDSVRPRPQGGPGPRNGMLREMRARRDSVMRQLRDLPPEVRDSVLMEFRATQPEWLDSVARERRQRLRLRDVAPDTTMRDNGTTRP